MSGSDSAATPFPVHAWYAVACDMEVGCAPFARAVCELPMALGCQADGELATLVDTCWHHRMSPTLGWLEGDDMVRSDHYPVYISDRLGEQQLATAAAPWRGFNAMQIDAGALRARPRIERPVRREAPARPVSALRPAA